MEKSKITLPNYWYEYLTEKEKAIAKNKQLSGKNSVTFAFITDFHLEVNELNSVKILTSFVSSGVLDKVFIGGDIVSGRGICTEEFLLNEVQSVKDAFKDIEQNCYYVEGNHDRAFSTFEAPDYYAQNVEKKKFTERYFKEQRKYADRVMSKDGSYYYVDDTENKVRYIVLNCQDAPCGDDETGHVIYNTMKNFGFLQEQVTWFCDVALKVPDDNYSIIIFSHATRKGASVEKRVYNYDVMHGIIDAFKNHTVYSGSTKHADSAFDVKADVDFTGAGGNVICWMGGHVHSDEVFDYDGIINVSTTTDAAYADYFNPTWRGTTLEQAFDVVTVDLLQKKVYVTRIGNGKDRFFEYK